MPPPNRILLPNVDPTVDLTRRILALETGGAVSVWGPWSESVDASHVYYMDFTIAAGVQPAIARLSFKFRLYRTTSSFSGGTTGSDASSESGHSHSHSHVLSPFNQGGAGPVTVGWQNAGTPGLNTSVAVTNDANSILSNAAGSSGHSHTHTHSVSGGSTLGVGEGTATTVTAIGVDGVDKTALLGGGPWAADTVDLDVSKVLPQGNGLWHYLQLTTAGQGRVVAYLKIAA